MSKGPEIKVIGKAPEEIKQNTEERIKDFFFNHLESLPPEAVRGYKTLEYPKSPEEIAGIKFANEETNLLMEEMGLESYDIPLGNYHLLPPELYRKIRGDGTTATTSYVNQAIIFNANHVRNVPIYFSIVAFHETLHLKGKLVMQVEKEGDKTTETAYRLGVSVKALQQQIYHEHNWGLHEAIVSYAEKKALAKLLERKEFVQEKKWRNSPSGKEIIKRIAKEKKISEEEIIWADHEKGEEYEIISYRQSKKVLEYVCREIQKEFPDNFADMDSVFKKFLEAHFTGHLIEIARLVEKTFGEGSFRELSNMTQESASAVLCLETLKKNRLRQLKNKK